jgi:alpha-glucosidase
VLGFYQHFLPWRRQSEVLCRGEIHFYETPEPVLALRRQAEGDRILAVFNLSSNPVRYTLPAAAIPLEGHGLEARLDGRDLQLPPWGGFFGRMV